MQRKFEVTNLKIKARLAIYLSLFVGFALFGLKLYIFFLTQAAVIFADLLESLVHLFVVAFATFSLILEQKPADSEHQYGHERIAFFSAGFEGAMILGAALSIIWAVLTTKSAPNHLEVGICLFSITFLVNGALAIYLKKRGQQLNNLILVANGSHLFSDTVTSLGVLVALVIVKVTGIALFDPLIAALIAFQILFTGIKLVNKAISGLMDKADPDLQQQLVELLNEQCEQFAITYHRLRHRLSGNRVQVDVHLQFSKNLSLNEAHEIATKIEGYLQKKLERSIDFVSHLEPLEGHDQLHERLLGRKENF
ncbi:MAG: Magnetosome protein MamB [Chlamydiales bacterium]|nr:Magnetosome protein MamB [Chlamydiales bacterium]MCH9636121.1 Magnetosome protein MamB [Chlamydiales bacterium]